MDIPESNIDQVKQFITDLINNSRMFYGAAMQNAGVDENKIALVQLDVSLKMIMWIQNLGE